MTIHKGYIYCEFIEAILPLLLTYFKMYRCPKLDTVLYFPR